MANAQSPGPGGGGPRNRGPRTPGPGNGGSGGRSPSGPQGPQGPQGPRPKRTPLQAVIYWTLVLGVWGLIFLVAFFAVFAVDLPDTSKLYEVKRQPSVSYLD